MEADAGRDTDMSDQDTSVVGTAIRDGHVRAAIIGAEADTPREQTQPVVPAPRQSVSVKGTWSEAEDAVLRHHVVDVKTTRWSLIATALPGRNGKQCRERWHNHLKPDINKDDWTAEEDEIVRAAHGEVGNKWTEIARRLKGRTDNQVKNRWNSTLSKQGQRSLTAALVQLQRSGGCVLPTSAVAETDTQPNSATKAQEDAARPLSEVVFPVGQVTGQGASASGAQGSPVSKDAARPHLATGTGANEQGSSPQDKEKAARKKRRQLQRLASAHLNKIIKAAHTQNASSAHTPPLLGQGDKGAQLGGLASGQPQAWPWGRNLVPAGPSVPGTWGGASLGMVNGQMMFMVPAAQAALQHLALEAGGMLQGDREVHQRAVHDDAGTASDLCRPAAALPQASQPHVQDAQQLLGQAEQFPNRTRHGKNADTAAETAQPLATAVATLPLPLPPQTLAAAAHQKALSTSASTAPTCTAPAKPATAPAAARVAGATKGAGLTASAGGFRESPVAQASGRDNAAARMRSCKGVETEEDENALALCLMFGGGHLQLPTEIPLLQVSATAPAHAAATTVAVAMPAEWFQQPATPSV